MASSDWNPAHYGQFADLRLRPAIDLLGRGAVDLSPLISHRFTLEELETAFRTQLDPEEAIKVLVRAAP